MKLLISNNWLRQKISTDSDEEPTAGVSKMFIRILSDIHNEFNMFTIPPMEEDNETVLILAGDIGVAADMDTILPFLEGASAQFHTVIYVLGNHEYYHGSLKTGLLKIQDAVSCLDNIFVVDNETITVGHVAFVCATLWSDFDNKNPICMHLAHHQMNDFKVVRTGDDYATGYYRGATPQDSLDLYKESYNYIFSAVVHEHNIGHIPVVVTHHAPSYRSIDRKYVGNPLNGAFATELSNEILDANPNLWIHGHMHNTCDYTIGETRVLCNPRGYSGREVNPTFNPYLRIEI